MEKETNVPPQPAAKVGKLSAQELVKNPNRDHFIYRDSVWRGSDRLG